MPSENTGTKAIILPYAVIELDNVELSTLIAPDYLMFFFSDNYYGELVSGGYKDIDANGINPIFLNDISELVKQGAKYLYMFLVHL